MPTLSFIPNVGASSVYTSVTGTITSVLAKADTVYADAKANLDLIKDETNKGRSVSGLNGGVASAIGINVDSYSESGFITQLQAQTISVAIDEEIDPPDKLTLSELKNNISFNTTRSDVDGTVSEPTAAVSYFTSVSAALALLRPATTHTLTTVVDDMEFDEDIDDAGRSIVEPAAAVSAFTVAITDAKSKRPGSHTLSTVTDNLAFDKSIDNAGRSVVEPIEASSSFDSAMGELKINRPGDHTLTTVSDNIEFNKGIENSGREVIEPELAVSYFTSAIDDLNIKRPGVHTLEKINTDVTIDSVTKPDITFVSPKEPTLPPITDLPFPSFSFDYKEDFYSSVLGSYLYTMILNELQNGSTGLTMSVENDIYSRESERDSLELQNTKDKISNMWAESGMSLPDGVLVSALAAVEIDFQNKYSDKSRDVRIESFKRADDNAKFIKDLALKYEQILMDYMGRYWDRQLDASKSLLLYMQQLYDAIYKYYAIYNERYKAEVEGYKATVEGQAAELEAKARVYDSEIRYVSSKADVELREILSEIEIQKNDLSSRQNTLRLFESDLKQVELYIGNLQAESANYGSIYSNRIAELDTKVKAFISEFQYEVEKANSEYKKTSVSLDIQRNEIAERQNVLSLYNSDISQTGLYVEDFKAESANYNTIYSNRISELDTKIKSFISEIQYEVEKVNYEYKKTSIDLDTQKNEIAERQNTLSLFQSDLKVVELYIGNLQAESANYGTIYSNRIADLDTKIKAFISEIQYEVEKVNAEYKKTSVDLDTQKNEIAERQNVISLYNSDISHAGLYVENLKAESANYSAIYNGRIAAIELKIKTFMANIQYEIEKVNAEAKRVGVELDVHKDKIAEKQMEIEVFKNELGYEVAKADVAVKKYSIEFDQYKTQAAIHQANVQFSDVDSRYHLGKLQALLESTKQEIDMMKLSVDATIAATSNIAQISSTMVAGALSALNANASMGTSESQGYSYGDNHSEATSESKSWSWDYNYDMTE